ncbi:MAG: hypothetical protein ACLTSZ_07565 [Lachnospiraceae bacterium]
MPRIFKSAALMKSCGVASIIDPSWTCGTAVLFSGIQKAPVQNGDLLNGYSVAQQCIVCKRSEQPSLRGIIG